MRKMRLAVLFYFLIEMLGGYSGIIDGAYAQGAGTYVDRSGSVTLGGTSQQLAAMNGARKKIIIENPCTAAGQGIGTAESLYINFTSAASTSAITSIELQACGSLVEGGGAAGAPGSSEAVNVTAATTGHKWIAKEM